MIWRILFRALLAEGSCREFWAGHVSSTGGPEAGLAAPAVPLETKVCDTVCHCRCWKPHGKELLTKSGIARWGHLAELKQKIFMAVTVTTKMCVPVCLQCHFFPVLIMHFAEIGSFTTVTYASCDAD